MQVAKPKKKKKKKHRCTSTQSIRTKSNFVGLSGLRLIFVIAATGGTSSFGNRTLLPHYLYSLVLLVSNIILTSASIITLY